MVRTARQGAIETIAQVRWVSAGRFCPLTEPSHDRDAARDRALGALLGLAVGDALGAAIEFEQKPRFAKLDDLVAGGPHRLERGQWTDDTAMALALADSLTAMPGLNPRDLMDRFVSWWRDGTYSCTGTCFDIGNATREALAHYERTGEPLAGSTNASRSGNGALMRLAPVAVRHWRDRDSLLRTADQQTRTTHGSPDTLDASRHFAAMLADAIAGHSLPEVLASPAAASIEGGWRGLCRDQIEGSGYGVRSLQAAVWAVSRTTSYREAVLLAANLGDDADTTAAVAGQLAGAIYGASGIPQDWLDALAWRGRIEETAGRLFDGGWPVAEAAESNDLVDPRDQTLGAPFAGCFMTADWTLRERLAALAEFRPVFEREDFVFAEHTATVAGGSVITMGFYSLTGEGQRLYKAAYDYGWVRNLDYHAWSKTERGERLLRDLTWVTEASEDDLACLLTVCIRADRFCEGYLAGAYESGLIRRIVQRADELLDLLAHRFDGGRGDLTASREV
jgi:ADP-ribosyl-[dinitrogen reductase] hydrolase